MESVALEKAVEFHGHLCPGLVIGYRAAAIALRRLGVARARDEELVAFTYTDACGADALQALTGCTFGKGNFFFKDYGKHVFVLGRRSDGRGIRVSLRAGAVPWGDREQALQHLLHDPEEQLYDVKEVALKLPQAARIYPSLTCARCGEPAMEPRLRVREGQMVCLECLEAEGQ